ncbi:hypothetical protein Trco_002469 [Trichoderma cornu-damae]|uniref:Uncharacterized protein n=1 Tax=Trichoderma cornu-damae TaxID=654480 RepID=A0A9P8QTQ5_9HYPO|nr:hypothetical protein Trco_002469 [Trichoderma cornu-damae]
MQYCFADHNCVLHLAKAFIPSSRALAQPISGNYSNKSSQVSGPSSPRMRFPPINTILPLAACLVSGAASLEVFAPADPCPTVTSTRTQCSTCMRMMCITESTISHREGYFVTLPCGCPQASGVYTKTVTACATSSPCWNCHTGFPFTTTATDCPEPTGKN